jgi:hypothetical protein
MVERMIVPVDDVLLSQRLNDAVGVHDREAQNICHLPLRQRKLEAPAVNAIDGLQPEVELAENVCKVGRVGKSPHLISAPPVCLLRSAPDYWMACPSVMRPFEAKGDRCVCLGGAVARMVAATEDYQVTFSDASDAQLAAFNPLAGITMSLVDINNHGGLVSLLKGSTHSGRQFDCFQGEQTLPFSVAFDRTGS